MEGRRFKAVKLGVNYGTCWDAVGAVSYSLCRPPSLLPFAWPDFSLTHLQLVSAAPLVHLRSFQDRLVPPLVAGSCPPHCRHAWFHICLERWLFFFALFLYRQGLYQPVSALFFFCSSYLTCLASSALCTCLLQFASFVVFSWTESLEVFLSVLVYTWDLCFWNSYVNKTTQAFPTPQLFQHVFCSLLTSQCRWQQEVCSILPDEVVSDGLGGGPAAKETDVPDELGGQGQRRLQEIPPLHSQVVHLPSSKLSAQNQNSKISVLTVLDSSLTNFLHTFSHIAVLSVSND